MQNHKAIKALILTEGQLKQQRQEIHLSDERYIEESVFVEKVYIKKRHVYFDSLTELCFASKNLYNAALYHYRQNYFEYKKIIQSIEDRYSHLFKEKKDKLSKQLTILEEQFVKLSIAEKDKINLKIKQLKEDFDKEITLLKQNKKAEIKSKLQQENFSFVDYYSINQQFVSEKQPDYYHEKLNAHTSQQILKIVQQNMDSFLSLLKKKSQNDYDKSINLPHYLDKDGLFIVPFSNQRIVKSTFKKEGLIHLSNTDIKFAHKSFDSLEKFHCIKQVRIIPKSKNKEKNREFVIEIVRFLFPHEKKQIQAQHKLFNSHRAIFCHEEIVPKLDRNHQPVFKEKTVSKRGVKKKDETGNKIIEKTVLLEQVFDKNKEYHLDLNYTNLAGLDVNLNQLAIAHFNSTENKDESFLVSLKHLKSINWQYNKKKAKLQSILDGLKNKLRQCELIQQNQFNWYSSHSLCIGFSFLTSKTQEEIIEQLKIDVERIKNKIRKLTTQRNKQIDIALHKISKKLVEQLNLLSINTLIIGKNKEWKQEINLGKNNNQNFVMLPFAQLLDKILYKANKAGIHVIFTEESFTSKTSFFDKETLLAYYNLQNNSQPKFIGKRIGRGLFQSSRKQLFHADVNGAYNIARKVKSFLGI